MNKSQLLLLLAIVLTLISAASLFIGDRLPDIVLAIVIIGLIPMTLILGIIILMMKNTKKGPTVTVIILSVFVAITHLSLRIPFIVIASIAFLIFLFARIHTYKQQGTISMLREVGLVLFFIYLLAVFNLTFSPFQFIAPYMHKIQMEWMPFKEIMKQFGRTPGLAMYYAVGNIAMTIPFGLFIPILFKRLRSFVALIGCGFGFSLLIEMLQMLFAYRSAEVDDLIFNTIGAVIGYFLFIILKKFVTLPVDGRQHR